jgi:hypothetical protein
MDTDANYSEIRKSWCLGSERFIRRAAEKLAGHPAAEHFGPEIHASAEIAAENIVQEEMKARGLTEQLLRQRRKSDTEKIQIAKRLREETTMTLSWIAHRLRMGTRTYLNHLLYWDRRGKKPGVNRGRQTTATSDISILLTDPTIDRSKFD